MIAFLLILTFKSLSQMAFYISNLILQTRTLKNFLGKHTGSIKAIFIFSVILFVIHEIGKISKDINSTKVSSALGSQSLLNILLMLILGFVAVAPMLNYDFMVTKFLPDHYPFSYVLKTGWITNTFTNIGGAGGLLGATMRALFYDKKSSKKYILGAVAKVALFLVSGLSIFCMISLVILLGFQPEKISNRYWIWLVLGSLYFPAVIIFSHLHNKGIFEGLSAVNAGRLVTGSFFEWLGCVVFFIFIGRLLQVQIDFWEIIPLFIIASVVGEVSMVPGGLGSFDVFMIIELGMVGLDKNIAVVWILLYRIFYYICPFVVGIILFIPGL